LFNNSKIEFPFPYDIRISKRAKRLNLKVSAEKGVQIIMPPFTAKADALAFLRENIAWVEKNVHIWQRQAIENSLPTQITFTSLQQTWQIEYMTDVINKRAMLLERPDNYLIYFGRDDHTLQKNRLRQWVKNKSSQFLKYRLRELSQQCDLPFNNVSFRTQRTLWGSCTQQKNISLNYKLIFLAMHLIDYILVHELAHTLHLDHSKKFWQLVAKFIPNYKQCCTELRHTEKLIPAWF